MNGVSLAERRILPGGSSLRTRRLPPGRFWTMLSNFTIQLIERAHDPRQHFVTARCETVHASAFGAPRLRRTQPAVLCHAGQHRIQRPGAQVIAVVVQFLEHPLTVDALAGRVVKNVNLPEREHELTNDWIAHGPPIIASRFVIGFRVSQYLRFYYAGARLGLKPTG